MTIKTYKRVIFTRGRLRYKRKAVLVKLYFDTFNFLTMLSCAFEGSLLHGFGTLLDANAASLRF